MGLSQKKDNFFCNLKKNEVYQYKGFNIETDENGVPTIKLKKQIELDLKEAIECGIRVNWQE